MRNLGKSLTTTLNNLTVSYTDDGLYDAPAIVFIHGFPLNKSMWSHQVESLKKNCRVITFDVRGHGESEIGSDTFSIDLFTDDLMKLMDALEVHNTALCGLSMGGYIALNAVQEYPKRFNALILCDTHCAGDTPDVKEKRMEDIQFIKKNGIEAYAEKNLEKLILPESLKSKKEETKAVKEMIKDMSVESLIRTLHALAERKETCTNLSQIDIPVLILMGEEDKITPPSKGQFMQNNINNSELKLVENAGHLSNLDNPNHFNKLLTQFVDSLYEKDYNKI